jgi:PhnB protein
MKNAIQPYLHFKDNCREAMQFYQELFGGELEMMKISESPASNQFSKEVQNQVIHSNLKNGNFFLMASDMCGMGELIQGNSVELNLNCSSEKEIRHLYNELSKGGQIIDELKEQFWGALFAMVVDRFGVRWMLSLDLGDK